MCRAPSAKLIRSSRLRERVKPGGTIAVGIGSRGIHGIDVVARAIVNTLKEMEYKPFIVAAMGSHGGATAEGQRELLAGYGVTAEAMGVPVKTDMDTVVLGTNPVGLPIYFDRNAYQADGIVLANRVKPHTDFRGVHESGVLKMLVIGLGKRDGASQVHKLGIRGLCEVLPAVGRFLVDEHPIRPGAGDPRERRGHHRRHRRPGAGDDLRRRAEAARARPRPDGPAAVRPDRRADRRRAGQELLGGRHGPQRHRPALHRDPARLRQAPGHAAGRARRLRREPRQHRRHRLRRPDDRAPGLPDGPRPVPDQYADLLLPGAVAHPHHPADRPRRDPIGARDLLADRPRRGPGGRHPQYARAHEPVGLPPARGGGPRPSPPDARDRISADADRR